RYPSQTRDRLEDVLEHGEGELRPLLRRQDRRKPALRTVELEGHDDSDRPHIWSMTSISTREAGPDHVQLPRSEEPPPGLREGEPPEDDGGGPVSAFAHE